jgi:Cu/Ag efflux protein CusF
MKASRISWGFVVLLLASFLLPAAANASHPGNTSATGVLVSLSAAGHTVTIQKSDSTQVMLRAGEHAALTRNGKPAPFGALALRDQVSVVFRGSVLVRLAATGPALESTRGVFTGLNATSDLLTLATVHGARSFQLTSSTLIVRNGAPATAQGLAHGDALLVHSATITAGATPAAADIEADGPEEEGVEGTITALAGQDVTITPEHGSAVTVHANASTVIKITDASGTHTASLADLATGMRAEADYDPVSLVADHIQARAAEQHQGEVEGKVTAVDATAGTISIASEHGASVILHTGSATLVSRNGAAATLADIKVGDSAEARYDATTLLASRIDARGETPDTHAAVAGQVTAVGASSLTITPEHGGAVTLTVDATTKIFLGDTAATLADVHVGQRAQAVYDRATLLAALVHVQGDNPSPNAAVEGSVTAVSATSITIASEHGSPVTLTIDASTRITRGDHPITAADIQVGDQAEALYVRATLLATRIESHPAHGDH